MKDDTESVPNKEIMKDPKKFSKWLNEQPWTATSEYRRFDDNDTTDTRLGNRGSKSKTGKRT